MKRVYTIGAAAEKIESQIKGAAEIVHAETLETAIRRAAAVAQPGDVVLLAPACASFDQFQNYEHRGRVFKEVVHSLESHAREGLKRPSLRVASLLSDKAWRIYRPVGAKSSGRPREWTTSFPCSNAQLSTTFAPEPKESALTILHQNTASFAPPW